MTSSDKRWQPLSGQNPKRSIPELRANSPPEAWDEPPRDRGSVCTQTKLINHVELKLRGNGVRSRIRSSVAKYFLYILLFEKKNWTFSSSLLGIPAQYKTAQLNLTHFILNSSYVRGKEGSRKAKEGKKEKVIEHVHVSLKCLFSFNLILNYLLL